MATVTLLSPTVVPSAFIVNPNAVVASATAAVSTTTIIASASDILLAQFVITPIIVSLILLCLL
jgi:hypothetical protein